MKNTSSFFFILAWREKQCFKIIKTSLDKNKTNNKQVRNRITKSDWAPKSFRARERSKEREREGEKKRKKFTMLAILGREGDEIKYIFKSF